MTNGERIIVEATDGARLSVQLMGEGRPLLLLHGLFSNGQVNWLRYGAGPALLAAGWRLILPDFRGHGDSGATGAARLPADVLAADIEAVATALGLGPELVVAGYSLGARTTVRLLARKVLHPRAALLSGMGLEGIVGGAARARFFIRVIEGRGGWQRGQPEFLAEAFMKANVADPQAILPVLRAQVATSREALEAIEVPVALVCGAEDADNGSAAALAAALPRARLWEVPGTHMTAVTRREFGAALVEALDWAGAIAG